MTFATANVNLTKSQRSMPRNTILFYTANGVGLGHLRRISLIIERLKSKSENTEIILVTSAQSPRIFGIFFKHCFKLMPLTDELLKKPSKMLLIRSYNAEIFLRALKKFKPDLIVADFNLTLCQFAFYPIVYALDRLPTKSILIWRLRDYKESLKDFRKLRGRLAYFNKIILPHNFTELKELSSLSLLLKNPIFRERYIITGPIFKKINKEKVKKCYEKYNISNKDFLITITLGGGGSFNELSGACESSCNIVKNFLKIRPLLVKKIPNLKSIIVTGPYFKSFKKKSMARSKFVKFEKNLLELLKISNIAISTAAYNTCNELIEAKSPSILVPLMRGGHEQFERAAYLEKMGIAKVFKNGSPKDFFDLIMNCKNNLDKMKLNFKKFSDWKQGNDKAAQEILSLLRNN